jgi:hypothetical protein
MRENKDGSQLGGLRAMAMLPDLPAAACSRAETSRRVAAGQRSSCVADAATRGTAAVSPSSFFFQLLPNLHSNFKISKNKSCSTSRDLQLCFLDHLQILNSFESRILNLGILKSND